jgi:NADPH:quinone reductase-like Zn-dependent oxidoreductase
MAMLVIEANSFSGYGGLRQIELPKPKPAKDRVLVRVTAAGVTRACSGACREPGRAAPNSDR